MYFYELKNGIYELHNSDGKVKDIGEEVAISYSYELVEGKTRSVLYKHGSSSDVYAHHNVYLESLKKLNENNKSKVIEDMIKNQYVIVGKLNIEDLNKCLEICDYIGKVHEKIMAGKYNV